MASKDNKPSSSIPDSRQGANRRTVWAHEWIYRCNRQRGAVAVWVAIFLPLFFLLIALVFDFGFLTSKRVGLQAAADAAALAAASRLNQQADELKATVVAMLRENGVDTGANNVDVSLGFYDEHNSYPDFPRYKEFARDCEDETPEGRYPNAVMVRVRQEVKTLEARRQNETSNEAAVGARSVAYVPHYGLVALGDGGIEVRPIWQENYPRFVDCPVHSNGDIEFAGTESFEGDCPVTAVGTILNGAEGEGGVKAMMPPDVDWDALRTQADHVYYVDDWDDTYEDAHAYYGAYSHALGSRLFVPKPGDHEGQVYYVGFRDAATPTGMLRLVINMDWNYEVRPEEWRAYNFTLAVAGNLAIAVYFRYDAGITMGKPDDGNVYIYTKGDLFIQDRASTPPGFIFDGVFFRCDGRFDYYTHTRSAMGASPHRWRIVAERIIMRGVFWNEVAKTDYSTEFGPWYPALETRLGQVELTANTTQNGGQL